MLGDAFRAIHEDVHSEMTSEDINNYVRRCLVVSGFSGTIDAAKARQIVDTVLAGINIKTHKITVDLSPVHVIGKPRMCNCNRSVIKVEILKTDVVR